jgi:hypothetical protein
MTAPKENAYCVAAQQAPVCTREGEYNQTSDSQLDRRSL